MSHSLIHADRNTHLKITAVALISAVVLIVVGLIARTDNHEIATARLHVDGPVLKAGTTTTVTMRDGSKVW